MKYKKGSVVPDWLVNGLAHFGADVVVTQILDHVYIHQAAMKDEECIVRFPDAPEEPPFKLKTVIWTQPVSSNS